jgi:trk system potassium uptake protein TrkA
MAQQVIVVGLGRFGSAAARELQALGHEVLAIDYSESAVNDIAAEVTHAVQADASDEAVLRRLGAADFNAAIVAMSSAVEASIFATMALKSLGVPTVVAKARDQVHGAILERVGADRVVYPEREAGIDVAHTLRIPHALDYIDLAPGFGVARVNVPGAYIGRTLRDLDLGGRIKASAIALRRGTAVTVNPHRDERLVEGDQLVLVGRDEELARLESEGG